MKKRCIRISVPLTLGPSFISFFFLCSFLLLACEKDVQKVCANSSEEHLQPFKDKMEGFVCAGG